MSQRRRISWNEPYTPATAAAVGPAYSERTPVYWDLFGGSKLRLQVKKIIRERRGNGYCKRLLGRETNEGRKEMDTAINQDGTD